jgi:hypothetical protein
MLIFIHSQIDCSWFQRQTLWVLSLLLELFSEKKDLGKEIVSELSALHNSEADLVGVVTFFFWSFFLRKRI